MAKSRLRIRACKMRKEGASIRDIARTLRVSKSSASAWCKDIHLSEKQIARLHESMVKGSYRGRLKGAQMQKERKMILIRKYEREGLKMLEKITKRNLLFAGLGLHLGEGSKTESKVRFTNSNPDIISLFVVWIHDIFGVSRSRMQCRVMINEIHRKREMAVRKEWSKILKIPLSQFRKTVFIKSKTKKIYDNYETFLGTITITIAKSSDLQYRILGLMKGLLYKVGRERPG